MERNWDPAWDGLDSLPVHSSAEEVIALSVGVRTQRVSTHVPVTFHWESSIVRVATKCPNSTQCDHGHLASLIPSGDGALGTTDGNTAGKCS